jgi:hypothetical protein
MSGALLDLAKLARASTEFHFRTSTTSDRIQSTNPIPRQQHIEMASRPTVTIHGADGAAGDATHPLPNVFRAPIRPDIVQYAHT